MRLFINQTLFGSSIIQLDAVQIDNTNTDKIWTIKTVISLPSGQKLLPEDTDIIENKIKQSYYFSHEDISFIWSFIPVLSESQLTVPDKSPEELHRKEIMLQWENFFSKNIGKDMKTEDLSIAWSLPTHLESFDPKSIQQYFVNFNLYAPVGNQEAIETFQNNLKEFIKKSFSVHINWSMQVFTFEKFQSNL